MRRSLTLCLAAVAYTLTFAQPGHALSCVVQELQVTGQPKPYVVTVCPTH
jgi:phospholipase/lecithinase/hemolysin